MIKNNNEHEGLNAPEYPSIESKEQIQSLERKSQCIDIDCIKQIIKRCPDTLREMLNHFNVPFEQLIILAAALATYSVNMPMAFFQYDRRKTYLQVMIWIVAPPSSGKGVLRYLYKLPSKVQAELIENANQSLRVYETELKVWKKASKSTQSIKPIAPKSPIMIVPGNTSSAALTDVLMKNGEENAILIFELEADAFGLTASKQEFGSMNSQILRNLFHSESVSSLRKNNAEHLVAENPKGAVIFSGTASQIAAILSSNQDGLFSRFSFFEIEGSFEWKDVFNIEGPSLDNHFDSLTQTFYDCWKYFKGKSIEVKFTKNQQNLMNDWGMKNLGQTQNFIGAYADSIPKRHTNMMARYAAILRLINYFENKETDLIVTCTEDNLFVAEWLCNLSIQSALKIFKTLPGEKITSQNVLRQQLWNALPANFSHVQLNEACSRLLIPERTKFNWIKGFIKSGILERINHGHYIKK